MEEDIKINPIESEKQQLDNLAKMDRYPEADEFEMIKASHDFTEDEADIAGLGFELSKDITESYLAWNDFWSELPRTAVHGVRNLSNSLKDIAIEGAMTPLTMGLPTAEQQKELGMEGLPTPESAKEAVKGATDLPEVKEPSTIGGKMVSTMIQVMLPYSQTGKIIEAGKNGPAILRTGNVLARGALADFLAFDDQEESITTMLKEYGFPEEYTVSLFDQKSSDSATVKRAKRALEDFFLVGPAAELVEGMFKAGFKANNRQVADGVSQIIDGINQNKVVKESVEPLKKSVEARKEVISNLTERLKVAADTGVDSISYKDLRQKETISKRAQREMGRRLGLSPERIRSGELAKVMEGKDLESAGSAAFIAYEMQLEEFGKAAPEIIARIDAGDASAYDDFAEMFLQTMETKAAGDDALAPIARTLGAMAKEPTVQSLNKMSAMMGRLGKREMRQLLGGLEEFSDNPEGLSAFLDGLTKNPEKVTRKSFTRFLEQAYAGGLLSANSFVLDQTASAAYSLLDVFERGAIAPIFSAIRGTDDAFTAREQINFMKYLATDAWNALSFMPRRMREGRTFKEVATEGIANFNKIQADQASKFDDFVWDRMVSGPDVDSWINSITSKVGIPTLKPNKATEGAAVALETLYGGIPRLMNTADQIRKQLVYQADIKARASTQAMREGLSGKEYYERIQQLIDSPVSEIAKATDITGRPSQRLAKESADEFQKRVAAVGLDTAQKQLDMAAQGVERARVITFTDDPTKFSQAFSNALDKIPILGRVAMPFRNTIDRLFIATAQRMGPFAAIDPKTRAMWKAGGRQRDLVLARLTTGTAMLTTGYYLAQSGTVTGGGPVQTQDRKNLQTNTGWSPYSIRVGDEYIDLRPYSNIVGGIMAGADLFNISSDNPAMVTGDNEPDMVEEYLAYALNAGYLLAESHYATGLRRTMDIFTASEGETADRIRERLDEVAASLASPGMVSGLFEPEFVQDPVGFGDHVRARFGKNVSTARNVYGQKVPLRERMFYGGPRVSPVKELNHWQRKIQEAGATPPALQQTIVPLRGDGKSYKGVSVKLNDEQFARYQELFGGKLQAFGGKTFAQHLEDIVSNPEWEGLMKAEVSLGPQTAKELIAEQHAEAKREALFKLQREYPEIDRRAMDKLGVTSRFVVQPRGASPVLENP